MATRTHVSRRPSSAEVLCGTGFANKADTVCDIRALSRKALLAVLDKFPEEEPLS